MGGGDPGFWKKGFKIRKGGLKGIVKFCYPLQVANFFMLFVQNSLRYVNSNTFESIPSVFLLKTGMFQRIKN